MRLPSVILIALLLNIRFAHSLTTEIHLSSLIKVTKHYQLMSADGWPKKVGELIDANTLNPDDEIFLNRVKAALVNYFRRAVDKSVFNAFDDQVGLEKERADYFISSYLKENLSFVQTNEDLKIDILKISLQIFLRYFQTESRLDARKLSRIEESVFNKLLFDTSHTSDEELSVLLQQWREEVGVSHA